MYVYIISRMRGIGERLVARKDISLGLGKSANAIVESRPSRVPLSLFHLFFSVSLDLRYQIRTTASLLPLSRILSDYDKDNDSLKGASGA